MLDNGTKRRIDNARQVLVGKVPDPKAQVEQITTALIYKFMDDMDQESVELGGKASFFIDTYTKYAWPKIMDKSLGGFDRLELYSEAITSMSQNPNLPQLFRDIFKDAFLPYRDPETLNLFLKEIDGFTYEHSERLGDAFEYLLSILGSQGAAGQFRTPRHIIDFIIEVVAPNKTDTILDPACGTAGFLISAYRHILAKNQDKQLSPDEMQRLTKNFVGYDISPDMVRLSLVNMYLHLFQNPTVYEYDTLTSEERWDDSFDVILANPPFMTPKGGIRPHSRFSVSANRSEVLFVDYIAEHLNPHGRAGVIVPEGIIFQSSNAYKNLRKMLIEEYYLYAVVSLPAGVFNPYSGVKTSVLLMDKTLAKRTDKILFVNIENDGFGLGAQRREIEANDLPEALQIIKEFQSNPNSEPLNPHLAHITLKKNITEDSEFNLSGARYKEREDLTNKKWPLIAIKEITTEFIDGDWIERKDQSKEGIRLIQTGNVGVGEFLNKFDKARFISEETFDRLQCTELFEGDVLISRLPDPVGRACIMPSLKTRMITAVDCTIVRFNQSKILPYYFLYLTKTPGYLYGVKPYLTGAIRKRISRRNLGRVEIPLPPLEVQQSIVHEIEGYQKIIDGARQVVENYKPKIIIDPDWPLVSLGQKDLFQIESGGTPSTKEPAYWDGDVNWVTLVDLPSDNFITSIKDTKRKITAEGLNGSSARLLPHNSILVSSRATIGRIGINEIELATNQGFKNIIIRDFKKINEKYVAFCITKLVPRMIQLGSGGTYKEISKKDFSTLQIHLPPIEVQQAIVDEIEGLQKLVYANTELIEIFEKKIENKIAEVWGEPSEG